MLERLRYEPSGTLLACKFARHEKRRMAQLHLVSSLARQSSHVFRLAPRNKLGDPLGDVVALLVEGILPEQARQHRAPKLTLRVNLLRHRSFVRSHREHPLPHIPLHHLNLPPFSRPSLESAVLSNQTGLLASWVAPTNAPTADWTGRCEMCHRCYARRPNPLPRSAASPQAIP